MVEGWLPVAAASAVAGLGAVRAVVAGDGERDRTARVAPTPAASSPEGDAAHNGPQARALGPRGAARRRRRQGRA